MVLALLAHIYPILGVLVEYLNTRTCHAVRFNR